jgi:putative flippase GtrA
MIAALFQKLKSSPTSGALIRYIVVGASMNLIAAAIVYVQRILGVPHEIAFAVTTVGSLLLNFYLQRSFVFRSNAAIVRSLILYTLLYASTYLLQIFIYPVFATVLGWPEILSVLFTVGVAAVYSFIVLSLVVFKPPPETPEG